MLTAHERRLLDELELQLEADDPRLAGKFRTSALAARLRITLLVASLLAIVGVVVGLTGLAETDAATGVAGLLLVGAGACVAAESTKADV